MLICTIAMFFPASNALAATPVSILQLKIQQEKFTDRKVAVKGFMPGTPTFLFLTKEHALMRDGSNAVMVDLSEYSFEDNCVLGYVQIWGTARKDEFELAIFDVERVYNIESSKKCEKSDRTP